VTCSSPLMVRLNEKEFTEPRRLIVAVQQASSAVQLVPRRVPEDDSWAGVVRLAAIDR